ncbi:MAG: TetR/AcrR family transcriptional regulator [Lachnospiraceae bacterium]|nr:TetR/AcrR family transcriptional regulator [Lachnospiraceae bacterium]
MGKKGLDTKERIKKATYQLFADKGFKEVTMKDICDNTGLSRGGLYRHYESTEQIFSEIISSFLTVQNTELQEQIDNHISAVDILNQLLEKYCLEMLDAKNSLSLAIYEYFSKKGMEESDNLLSQQYQMSFSLWDRLIRYGISQGDFRQVDSRAVFDLVVFSYQGVRMYSLLMDISEDVPHRMMKQIQSLLIF